MRGLAGRGAGGGADAAQALLGKIRDTVLPGLVTAIAAGNPARQLDEAVYRQAVMVLFRILILGHTEARGMLAGREHPGPLSVTGRAAELAADPGRVFTADSTELWDQMSRAWAAAAGGGGGEGDLPAPGTGPVGAAATEGPALTDAQWGPALADLLVDTGAGPRRATDLAVLGPGEFIALYHELLDSMVSIARTPLNRRANGTYTPRVPSKGGPDVQQGALYLQGRPFKQRMGPRRTPPAVVEHLLRATLAPGIDAHLRRVAALLKAEGAAAAEERLFDFMIADPAMGVGEFLGSAIDLVAGRYEQFLAAYPEAGQGRRWAGDPVALRQEIAGRMIYGVDIDPVAVSLARLAVQAHVSADGRPVAGLAQHLVRGDSLTGLASVAELRRVGEQAGWQADGTWQERISALQQAIGSGQPAGEDGAEALFDAAAAVSHGLVGAGPSVSGAAEAVAQQGIRDRLGELRVTHFPILFPEVFLRRDPGFDVVVSNPPWGFIPPSMRHAKGWIYRLFKKTSVPRPDYAQLAAERGLALVRAGGWLGLLLPGTSLASGEWDPVREALVEGADLDVTQVENDNQSHFAHQLTLALVARGPASEPGEPSFVVHPVVASVAALADEEPGSGIRLPATWLRPDEQGGATIPRLATAEDLAVVSQLRKRPPLSAGDWIAARVPRQDSKFRENSELSALIRTRHQDGAWTILNWRVIGAYRISADSDVGEFIYADDLPALAALDSRVVMRETGNRAEAQLAPGYPALAYVNQMARKGRALSATALPSAGALPDPARYVKVIHTTSPDAVRADPSRSAETRDQLALLGYLDSMVGGWWVRRFTDSYISGPLIEGMRLPDWTDDQRREVADRVAELLIRIGLRVLPGGRRIDLARPHQKTREWRLRAEIDLLVMEGLDVRAAHLETILNDFEESREGMPPDYRDRLWELFADKIGGRARPVSPDGRGLTGQQEPAEGARGPAVTAPAAAPAVTPAAASAGQALAARLGQRPLLGRRGGWITATRAETWNFKRYNPAALHELVSATETPDSLEIIKSHHIRRYRTVTTDPNQYGATRLFVNEPAELARRDGRVVVSGGQARLTPGQPVIVYRHEFATKRIVMAAAVIPAQGKLQLPNHTVRALDVGPAKSREALALVGYLNSVMARWLVARRLSGKVIKWEALEELPLPELTERQLEALESRVAELLIKNELRELPFERTEQGRPHEGKTSEQLEAEIDQVFVEAFKISQAELETILDELDRSGIGVTAEHREALLGLARPGPGAAGQPEAREAPEARRARPPAASYEPAAPGMAVLSGAIDLSVPAPYGGTSAQYFVGGGGMAIGSRDAGMVHVAGVEIDPDAVQTLLLNGAVRYDPNAPVPASLGDPMPVIEADVRTVSLTRLADQLTMMEAAPPCPDFSEFGRLGRGQLGWKGERNLFDEVFRGIRETHPEMVLIENVPGLLEDREFFRYLLHEFEAPFVPEIDGEEWWDRDRRLVAAIADRGADPAQRYDVQWMVLNAANYGIPQIRYRVFIVAFRRDLGVIWHMPEKTHSQNALWRDQLYGDYWTRHGVQPRDEVMPVEDSVEPADGTEAWVTIRDLLKEMRDGSEEPLESRPPRTNRPRAEAPDRQRHAEFKPQDVDLPGRTVLASGNRQRAVYLGDGTAGRLTINALKKVMGFPASYQLAGKVEKRLMQLGNSVPPKLVEIIVRSMVAARQAEPQRQAAPGGQSDRGGQGQSLPLRPSAAAPGAQRSAAGGGETRPSGDRQLRSAEPAADWAGVAAEAARVQREVQALEAGRLLRRGELKVREEAAQAFYQRLKAHLAIRTLPVDLDGDCFYNSVMGEETFRDRLGQLLRQEPTVELMRLDLHQALADELDLIDRGLPTRYDAELLFPLLVTADDVQRRRRETLARIKEMGGWDFDSGDSVPQFAALRWKLPMTVLGQERPYHIGPDRAPEGYLEYSTVSQHYLGAESDYEVVPADVLYQSPEAAPLRELEPEPRSAAELRRDYDTYQAAFGQEMARFERLADSSLDVMASDQAGRGYDIVMDFQDLSRLMLSAEPTVRPQDRLSQQALDRLGGLFEGLKGLIERLENFDDRPEDDGSSERGDDGSSEPGDGQL